MQRKISLHVSSFFLVLLFCTILLPIKYSNSIPLAIMLYNVSPPFLRTIIPYLDILTVHFSHQLIFWSQKLLLN